MSRRTATAQVAVASTRRDLRWPRIVGGGADHAEADVLGVPFAERAARRVDRRAARRLRRGLSDAARALPPAADPGQHRPVQEDGPRSGWVVRRGPRSVGGLGRRVARRPVTRELVDEIAWLRADAGRHDPFDLGALVGPVFVGELTRPRRPDAGREPRRSPTWSTSSALGVGQAQVRLRSRSLDELVDQIGRFGADVIPQMERA